MELQMGILLWAIGVNLLSCLVMLGIQWVEEEWCRLELRLSVIGGNKKAGYQRFLYWQDFYCQKYGCTIGLSLTTMGFFHLVNHIDIRWSVFVLIALFDAISFTVICLRKTHKPDWGYPEAGRISTGGKTHSLYHGLQVAMVSFLLWSIIFTGVLRGWPMWLAIIGMIIYSVTLVIDIKKGHFASLIPLKSH